MIKEQKQEIAQLKEIIAPKLEIIFGIEDIFCYQKESGKSFYRIGIHNLSKSTYLQDVIVKLEKITPCELMKVLPVKLHQMHDNTKGNLKESFDVYPDITEYIDVIGIWDKECEKSNEFDIYHIQDNVHGAIEARSYDLVISASAKNCLLENKKFIIRIDNDGTFRFSEPLNKILEDDIYKSKTVGKIIEHSYGYDFAWKRIMASGSTTPNPQLFI